MAPYALEISLLTAIPNLLSLTVGYQTNFYRVL